MEENIKQAKVKDIQHYELKILSEFHKICEEYNLKYILDYGTLLGAVRHNGFIPWDDDVDVAMPRKDFERFKKVAKEVLPNNMFLQDKSTDKNYFLPLPKIRMKTVDYREECAKHFKIVHGPWIDIFVYDFKNDDYKLEKNKQIKVIEKSSFVSYIHPVIYSEKLDNQNFIKTFIKKSVINILEKAQDKDSPRNTILKYLDFKYKQLENILDKYPIKNDSGKIISYLLSDYASLNIDDFTNRKLHKFENHLFYIPENYNKILTSRYGDYNKFPPLNERKPLHRVLDYHNL